MENITEFEIVTSYGKVVKHILIDRGNGEYTTMPKANYDAQQAQQVEHLTEIPTPDEA